MKNRYSYLPSFGKLLVVAAVSLLSLFVLMIVASVIAIPVFGPESVSGLMNGTSDLSEDNLAFLKFVQLVQSVGLFIVPSLFLALVFGGSISQYLRLQKKPYLVTVIIATVIIFASSPIINFTGELNSKLSLPSFLSGVENWMRASEDSAAVLTKMFLEASSFGGVLFNIFLIALIPAIGEEFLFRGVIQRVFTEWTKNKHWGIWLSAILFSFLHFQFYGFIPRALLGGLFGYLFVMSGNLWLPVIAHFANNAVAVVSYYLYGEGVLNVDPEKIGVDTQYPFATIISVVVIATLLWYMGKYEKGKRQKLMVD